MSAGVFILYRSLSTANDRRIHRLMVLNTFQKGKYKAEKAFDDETFQTRLEDAGLDFLTPYRYEFIRWGILIVLTIYYVVVPAFQQESVTTTPLSMIVLWGVVTEHRVKNRWLSWINMLLDMFIRMRLRRKEIEIFTLYDLLKADLSGLKDGQEINVYSLLKQATPMFDYIQRPLSRFLSLWMTDPSKAKTVFYDEIGTQGAKTIGEVLIKIDSSTKKEAYNILKNESSVYQESFYKHELERQLKRKNYLIGMFSVDVFLKILWLLVIISTVVLGQLEGTLF